MAGREVFAVFYATDGFTCVTINKSILHELQMFCSISLTLVHGNIMVLFFFFLNEFDVEKINLKMY